MPGQGLQKISLRIINTKSFGGPPDPAISLIRKGEMRNSISSSGYAPVLNGQLYYEIAGSGPPVLFIHAGVADCSMWDGQFTLFSQKYQVIRYDTRGFGKSRTEDTEFSNRQDILDLYHFLGIEQACVIGISRGGQIAINFTLEHPDRVSALIPVAAGISGFEYQPGDNKIARCEFELFTHMDELWEKKAFAELADLEAHAWADGPSQPVGRASPQLREYIHRIVLANYTRQDGKAAAQPLNPPAAKRLHEIQIPTLILIGDYDETTTQVMADKLEADISGARKVVFHATAHMIPMEQPEKFNQLVLEFLDKVI
jgi:3-oxoadipate enol-lactonase